MPHKCHRFGKQRPLLKRHIEAFHEPNGSIESLLVPTCNRVVVILNTKLWGTGRHPSLKEALPFHMFTWPKHFPKHRDGFGEARNTFGSAGYRQIQSGEMLCSFSCSVGESCWSIWHPRWVICFDKSLCIFICFAIFMTPHWSNYRVLFSEKNLVTAMTSCFSMGLCTLSPGQVHGNSIHHIQKLWVYQQLYNHLQNRITLETPT